MEENGKEEESESNHMPIMAGQILPAGLGRRQEDQSVVWAPAIRRPFMVLAGRGAL